MRTITITDTLTGATYVVGAVADPKSSRKRAARDARVLANNGVADCGHAATAWVAGEADGVEGYALDVTDADRHYRDGDRWDVEGEHGSKDYAPDAILAVCKDCNQHGRKPAALQARLDEALVAALAPYAVSHV